MRKRKEAQAARDEISDQLRLEGIKAAYQRSIKMLNDDDVPATAHAQLVRVMFQAAGLFTPNASDEPEKEPHEMTADELGQELGRLMRARDARLGASVAFE